MTWTWTQANRYSNLTCRQHGLMFVVRWQSKNDFYAFAVLCDGCAGAFTRTWGNFPRGGFATVEKAMEYCQIWAWLNDLKAERTC